MDGHVLRGPVLPPRSERAWPANDVEAWLDATPETRWLFNRMALAIAQGLRAEPHGVVPERAILPVLSRPLMNLEGMGMGAEVIEWWTEDRYRPGHFWQPFEEGPHLSTDLVICRGEAVWSYGVRCEKDYNRTFRRFTGVPGAGKDIWDELVWRLLPEGYTGVLNVETINETVIEVHLRPNLDMQALYPSGYVKSLDHLYRTGTWVDPGPAMPGVCIPVRAVRSYSPAYRVNRDAAAQLDVMALSVDFRDGEPLEWQPNDLHTYRLARVVDADEEKADAAALHFMDLLEPVQAGAPHPDTASPASSS